MVDSFAGTRRVSAPAYFSGVAVATLLGVAAAMFLRPAFGHTVLQLLGLETIPQAMPGSFYTVRVAPLFEAHCTSCHGAERQKAELRLDSFAAAMRGGKHGAVITPNVAKDSPLFTRITLPATDDRAMPPSGKTPLSKDDVTVIRLWIAAGASGALPVNAIKGAPALVVPVKMPELDLAAVQKQRAPLANEVSRLQERFPGIIHYDSRSSADLEIDASLKGATFGDSDLKALLPLRDRIVSANLSGTGVTDASAPLLASMKALRVLRLMNTKTTDATVAALASSKMLRVLAVAKATPGVLAPLRQRGVRVYEDVDVR
jgi:hypothetical protein